MIPDITLYLVLRLVDNSLPPFFLQWCEKENPLSFFFWLVVRFGLSGIGIKKASDIIVGVTAEALAEGVAKCVAERM